MKTTKGTRPILNTDILNARSNGKVQKIPDAAGLYLEVRPKGDAMYWRYRYRDASGKQQTYTIGPAGNQEPLITIAKARLKRAEAEAFVRQGIKPRAAMRAAVRATVTKQAQTLAVTAEAWLLTKGHVTKRYRHKLRRALDECIIPVVGDCLLDEVTTHMLWDGVLKPLAKTPSWALHVRLTLAEIFAYSATVGLSTNNPTYSLRDSIGVKGKALIKYEKKNHPHLELHEVPDFFTAVDAATGQHCTKLAIKLALLTLVRPGELAGAPWAEFDFERAIWEIPAERTKKRRAHLVPLSVQAIAILRELQALNGDTPYILPERKPRLRKGVVPKDTSFLRQFTKQIGYGKRVNPHGLRGTASTALNDAPRTDGGEGPRFDENWIEAQLSHKKGGVAGHYNKAKYLQQRIPMMQAWADMVMPRKATKAKPTNVVQLRKALKKAA